LILSLLLKSILFSPWNSQTPTSTLVDRPEPTNRMFRGRHLSRLSLFLLYRVWSQSGRNLNCPNCTSALQGSRKTTNIQASSRAIWGIPAYIRTSFEWENSI
jgi:hypothetical protein